MSQALYREVSSRLPESAPTISFQQHPTACSRIRSLLHLAVVLPAQLHPPTAVTHCVEAYFTHPAPAGSNDRGSAATAATTAAAVPPNLVVARGTQLEVYALK
jgi:hypothetical protein